VISPDHLQVIRWLLGIIATSVVGYPIKLLIERLHERYGNQVWPWLGIAWVRLWPQMVCLAKSTFIIALGWLVYVSLWKPQIRITSPPLPGRPGTFSRGEIKGHLSGHQPRGSWVLVYACVRNDCYIQPLADDYHIHIREGAWNSSTHLGDRYYALLVTADFVPPILTSNIPGGEEVLSIDQVRVSEH
jgi:hypothetical protein